MSKVTPMIEQYQALKADHRDAILFFRKGAYYEIFGQDATEAAKILDLTVAASMCSVPIDLSENYTRKLIESGRKVAICEELSDPSMPGIVKRKIVSIISPGTTFDSIFLNEKENNFIMSIFPQKDYFGIAFADITTGEFYAGEIQGLEDLKSEIDKFQPAEIVVWRDHYEDPEIRPMITQLIDIPLSASNFYDEASHFLRQNLKVTTLEPFGVASWPFAIQASAILMKYLMDSQQGKILHINKIHAYKKDKFMTYSSTAKKCLNIAELLEILDRTQTAMGARLLRKWIRLPLLKQDEIQERQDAVENLVNDEAMRTALTEDLSKIVDLERTIGKLATGNESEEEMKGLAQSLAQINTVKTRLNRGEAQKLRTMTTKLILLDSNIHSLEEIKSINQNSKVLAELDAILSLANAAVEHNFRGPKIIKERILTIDEQGFVEGKTEFQLITGINKKGKTKHLSDLARNVLMAQIGSFIPAKLAQLPIFDAIHARVGETDLGTEMKEINSILNSATKKSLIIIDEFANSAGSYDGLSLAWAVMEYLHDKICAFTLFTSNFHELIALANKLERAKNFSFMEDKIHEGPADIKYGIELAKKAGLPKKITSRANIILKELKVEKSLSAGKIPENQLDLFKSNQTHSGLDKLTPDQALSALKELKLT